MSKSIPIRHLLIWANIYIVIGVFCTLFFLSGSLLLGDYKILVYGLASIAPIVIGVKMRKSNYALVSEKRIQVFGLFGQLRKDYKLEKGASFILKSDRIFIENKGKYKKVSINNWFINQYDWKRAIELFDTNETNKLTKHLIDD